MQSNTKWDNLPQCLDYKQVAEILGISDKSVSQFLGKHESIRRGHTLKNGRQIGVVDRDSLQKEVNELNYTGDIREDRVLWAN